MSVDGTTPSGAVFFTGEDRTLMLGEEDNIATVLTKNRSYSGLETTVAVILLGYLILGLSGNLLTIIALLRCQRVRNVTAAFIISLCVADCLFCVLVLPWEVSRFFAGKWVWGRGLICTVLPLIRYWNVAVSLLSIAMITLNRYIMIAHFRIYKSVYKKRWIALMIAFCWLFPFCILLPTLFGKWALHLVGYVLVYLSCCINPVIYVIMNRQYRQAYRSVLLCKNPILNSFSSHGDDTGVEKTGLKRFFKNLNVQYHGHSWRNSVSAHDNPSAVGEVLPPLDASLHDTNLQTNPPHNTSGEVNNTSPISSGGGGAITCPNAYNKANIYPNLNGDDNIHPNTSGRSRRDESGRLSRVCNDEVDDKTMMSQISESDFKSLPNCHEMAHVHNSE
ncbi:G-protein coupled receptor moody [Armadillidium nasatum]|uniref:G-protein coupled receptor moody n=1 Tax=Armadillidium nasatum TaxID=96803 RepID=A0A5N5SY97_9CRUS|nr:G-protein coupled receptor moody [Armadillidium nasatum]